VDEETAGVPRSLNEIYMSGKKRFSVNTSFFWKSKFDG
jgi:hypothetical protein